MHSKRLSACLGLVVLCGSGCGIDAAATGTGARGAGGDASTEPSGPATPRGPSPDGGFSDGGCADVQSDSNHCGQCGHSCLEGVCASGKCAPVVMVRGEPGLGAVALEGTSIYYVAEDSGTIRTIPVAGGAPRDVHPTGRRPRDLVLAADRVFWADPLGAGMHVLAPTPSTALLSTGAVTALATTGSAIYMIALDEGRVAYRPRDFAGPSRWLNSSGTSPAIVVDAANAYWSAQKQIRRSAFGTLAYSTVVSGLDAPPTSMAITSTHVYWATPTAVERATIASGTSWDVAALVTGEKHASSLAVDDSGIYWRDAMTGELRRAPLVGGAPETLATFSTQRLDAFPRQIALSPTAIYVASTTDGTLSRLAK